MPHLSLRRLWRKKSVNISEKDPSYKVVYLGNVITGWAKGDGCVDKPLCTLWRNYCQSNRSDIVMKITICGSGLQAVTRGHGLTEYWAHRVTYCGAHPAYPKVFCWVYRHEGRRLKQELRCHAVLCNRSDKAQVMAAQLKTRLTQALLEFRREKVVRQNARLSLVHAIYDSAALPSRKVLLSTGSTNYRPPLERSKSAPKLGSIEETIEEEDDEDEDDESPIEEEDEGEMQRHKYLQVSPAGSLTLSDTMSDIVHGSAEGDMAADVCLLARSASHRAEKTQTQISDGEVDVTKGDAASLSSSLRASNSRHSRNGNTSSSHSNNFHSSINDNYNNHHNASTSNHVNSNNEKSLHAYSRQLNPGSKPPVLKRRFLRSISVDASLDDDFNDFDLNDFDDTNEMISREHRLQDSPASICPAPSSSSTTSNTTKTSSMRQHFASTKVDNVDDTTEDGLCSSLASTDTTDTVLDVSCSALTADQEDTLSLVISLSQTFSRQASLGLDARHQRLFQADESLTSDQPESLGSHCDSCSSSCGGCSDGPLQEDMVGAYGDVPAAAGGKTRLFGLVVADGDLGTLGTLGTLSTLTAEAEEPDNISEESGYAEEKDFLQSAELTRTLNV